MKIKLEMVLKARFFQLTSQEYTCITLLNKILLLVIFAGIFVRTLIEIVILLTWLQGQIF